jgi:hypothetical protein
MWTIIIIVLAVIVVKFLYDKNQQSTKVTKEGGMLHKYKILIDFLMGGDSRTKIMQVKSDFVSLGVSSIGGSTVFSLTQTFGKVTVEWKIENPVFGKHNLQWEFDEYLDQEKMIDKIVNDLSKYQNNVMTAQGYPDTLRKETKPKHKDLSTVSKSEYDNAIRQQIAKKDYAGALLMIKAYKDYYPEEAERLEVLREKIEDLYYDSDNFKNSDLPF